MHRFFLRPRVLLSFAIAALAAVLGTLVFTALYRDPREARALRTPGAIVGVTYGNAPLVLGANWQKWLLALFPRLEKHIGGKVCRRHTPVGARSLVIWQNPGPFAYLGSALPQLPVRLTGDRGETMNVDLAITDPADFVGGDSIPIPFEATAFPRRGRHVRIRLEGSAEPELMIPNPTPGPHPVWNPGPMPASSRSGPAEVVLDRLEIRTAAPGKASETLPGSQLHLHIREEGRLASGAWFIQKVELLDATGNLWSPSATLLSGDNTGFRLGLGSLSLPGETAYRVRLLMVQANNFPSEEVWPLTGLAVPQGRRLVQVSRKKQFPGGMLELTHLAAPWATAELGKIMQYPAAAVRFTGSPDQFWVADATEPLPQKPERWSYTEEVGNGAYLVGLRAARGKQSGPLKVALTPRRTVEFLIPAPP